FHPRVPQLVQRLIHLRPRDDALLDIDDVPRLKAEETSHAFRAMDADAIAIAVCLHRGDDRPHRDIAELADPAKGLLDLLLLERELRIILQVLVNAAATATEEG